MEFSFEELSELSDLLVDSQPGTELTNRVERELRSLANTRAYFLLSNIIECVNPIMPAIVADLVNVQKLISM